MKRKMNRTVVGILTAAAVLTLGTASAFAAGAEYGKNPVNTGGDGVCRYIGNACRYIDADNDGICDNSDKNQLCREKCDENFVDADGDGICDNYGAKHGRGFRGCHNK